MTVLDWAAIGLYVIAMLGIGAYYARRSRTQDDYLLGGRRMNPIGVGLSYFATLFSTLTYLGVPGEMVRNGPAVLAQVLALPLAWIAVTRFVIPIVMRQPVTTAHEILEVRLGLGVRTLAATLFLVLRMLWMGLIIQATATQVLVPVIGLDPKLAPLVGLVMAVVTVVYTSLGGFKAVVATDVVQTVILLGGAVLCLGFVTFDQGGLDWLPDRWLDHWAKPSLGLDLTARRGVLSLALTVFVWQICTASSDQMAVQRYLATRDAAAAGRMLATGLVCNGVVLVLLVLVGAALLAHAQAHPGLLGDPAGVAADADAVFPRFIALALPSGIRGLVVGGLLAAAMSSLSSGLSAMAAVVTVDFVERLGGRRAADFYGTLPARILPWAIGLVVVAIGMAVSGVEGNIFELCNKIVNAFTAPLAGIFLMAMFMRRATVFGVWVGLAAGLATVVGVTWWPELTGRPGIGGFWMMPLAIVAQLAVGAAASRLPIGPPARPLLAPVAER
jgi:SSS family solute:Na+ symporter